MNKFQLKGGATVNILGRETRTGNTGKHQTYYQVQCRECKHTWWAQKPAIEKRKGCPNCTVTRKGPAPRKPAALKTDDVGNCIAICELGQVEFIREYQDKHSVSERGAVRAFIEAVKAHVPEDDPINDQLTEGSVRKKVRRATGKDQSLSDLGHNGPKNKDEPYSKPASEACGKPLQSKEAGCYVKPTVESVTAFLEKYMPGYVLLDTEGCETF